VLDWRWEAEGVDRAIGARPDVVVHARSALLQGVLAHPPERWPGVDGFSADECWQTLRKLAADFGRESVTDLCMGYVRSLPWITSVVIGCENMRQLEENLRLSRAAKLTPKQCERLRRELPQAPENFLNPSKWKTLEKLSATR
jgi:aryl-alcohol dehydrogenase-like predicted oxidoreductase